MPSSYLRWYWARMQEVGAWCRGDTLPGTLLVRPSPVGIQASRRRGRRTAALGQFASAAPLLALRRRRETLTLASDTRLLRRVVTLQMAAERGLATLLHYEMDRLTPFAADDVYWDWRLLRRDAAAGTLDAELVLLPRKAIAAPLQALADAGLRPDHVEAAVPGGGIRSLPLDEPDAATPQRARVRTLVALGVCTALGVACVALPLIRQQDAVDTLDDEVAALRPKVAEAQALQQRITGDAAGGDALAAGRAHAADVLTAIAALTDALPDDTALGLLSMHQRRLTMEGQTTGAATRLIAAVAGTPHLRAPAFTAPIVRGDAGNDIFALQAELVP